MGTIITDSRDLLMETEGLTVTLGKPVLVASGEYAEGGEPDYVVIVHMASDAFGNDRRKDLARAISAVVDRYHHSHNVDNLCMEDIGDGCECALPAGHDGAHS